MAFWIPRFLMRNLLMISLRTPACEESFLSCCFKDFVSLFRQFDRVSLWVSLSLSHLELDLLLGFIDSYLVSRSGCFRPLFQKIPALCCLSSSGTPRVHMVAHLTVSCRSLKCCSLFFHLFLFLRLPIISVVLSSCSLILSSACSNILLNLSSEFSISVVYFSAPELFSSFLSYLSLYWYFCFVHISCSWFCPLPSLAFQASLSL